MVSAPLGCSASPRSTWTGWPWLIDFGFGTVAALPRLQPDGLSTATRKAMKAHKGLEEQLQETTAAAVDVEKVQLQHLERVQPRHVLTLLATALAAYFLIRQVTEIRDLPAILARMDWSWVVSLVASALTYVGAALNPDRWVRPAPAVRPDHGRAARGVLHQPHHTGEGRRHGGQRPLPPEAGARLGDHDRRGGDLHAGRGGLREALRDPARLSLSFLGALLTDLAYIVALLA
jgi:hypothetical protein